MKPILFKTEMVNAILKKGKRQTRRLMSPQPLEHDANMQLPMPLDKYVKELNKMTKKGYKRIVTGGHYAGQMIPQPKYKVGDLLYVKETWQHTSDLGIHHSDENSGYIYKASENGKDWAENTEGWKWKPSLFMPKEAARLFLKITSVRFEPLCMITESDAVLEGVSSIKEYAELWDSIAKDKGSLFEDNPAVFVYDFEIQEIKYNDYETLQSNS